MRQAGSAVRLPVRRPERRWPAPTPIPGPDPPRRPLAGSPAPTADTPWSPAADWPAAAAAPAAGQPRPPAPVGTPRTPHPPRPAPLRPGAAETGAPAPPPTSRATPRLPAWYEPVIRPIPNAAPPTSRDSTQQASAAWAVTFRIVCTLSCHGAFSHDGRTVIGAEPPGLGLGVGPA